MFSARQNPALGTDVPTRARLAPPHAVLPPKAGPGPQRRLRGEHPGPLEDPEQEGSLEEELGALPHPSAALDADDRGRRTRDPILLSLPGPLVVEGLADAALQDGECLPGPTSPSARHLLEGSPPAVLEEKGRKAIVTPVHSRLCPVGEGSSTTLHPPPTPGAVRRGNQHALSLQWST